MLSIWRFLLYGLIMNMVNRSNVLLRGCRIVLVVGRLLFS